jgi:hypothetical protein
MQRVVIIPYPRFGTIYLLHFQDQESIGFLTVEDGPIGCPEPSVRNYHYTLRNVPEECSSRLLCGRSLKLLVAKTLLNKILLLG